MNISKKLWYVMTSSLLALPVTTMAAPIAQPSLQSMPQPVSQNYDDSKQFKNDRQNSGRQNKDEQQENAFQSAEIVVNENIVVDSAPALVLAVDAQVAENNALLETTGQTDTVSIAGANVVFNNQDKGEVRSQLFGVSARNLDNDISNNGVISGDIFGVNYDIGSTGRLENFSTITSNLRAVHVAGDDVTVINYGEILGTADQFDGTLYLDAPGEQILVNNLGTIDTGVGNNGAAVSFEVGDEDGDEVQVDLRNRGSILGRGVIEEGTFVGDGLRFFTVDFENTIANGDIFNRGDIIGSPDSTVAVGISIDNGVEFTGTIVNHGRIIGTEVAIDTRAASGQVSIRNNGRIEGDVLLSAGDDNFRGKIGLINGEIDSGAGDDYLETGRGDDVIIGGAGNDVINGGAGKDSLVFADRSSSDFTIESRSGRRFFGGGATTLVDNLSGETDTLLNIETIIFADEEVSLRRDNNFDFGHNSDKPE